LKKRILFIHHGSGLGGAPISMLYLIQNLDLALYEPVVACGFEEPRAKVFFEDNGFNPLNVFLHGFYTSGQVDGGRFIS
jgi:hypothetical protein